MNNANCIVLALLAVVACSPDAVGTSDVIQLALCPAGNVAPCSLQPAADGHSTITAQVCAKSDSVPARDRRTDLSVALHATRGSWLGHDAADPTSISVPLGASNCRLATLVTDQTPGAVEVDATLLDYTAATQIIQIPAVVSDIDFTAANTPPLQGTDDATAQFTVTARASGGGLPSAGTRVAFSVENVRPSGSVAISPLTATLDASGSASVSLFVPSAVEQLSLKATVTPPDHSELGVAPLDPVLGEFAISRQ